MISWLIVWLIDWLIGWLVGQSIDRLIDRSIDRSIHWLIDRLIHRSIGWLIDWLIGKPLQQPNLTYSGYTHVTVLLVYYNHVSVQLEKVFALNLFAHVLCCMIFFKLPLNLLHVLILFRDAGSGLFVLFCFLFVGWLVFFL